MEINFNIEALRLIWNSFSKEWKTVLKSNIFNWFVKEEEQKIFLEDASTDADNDSAWWNIDYKLTNAELYKIFRIKYLSTVIPDATRGAGAGGCEYTPELDLSILAYFNNLTYLDLSCCCCSTDWNVYVRTIPIMKKVTDLRIIFNDIHDLEFIKDIFPNVSRMDCSNNIITSLRPLYNLKITELSCSNNPISSNDIWDFFRNNPSCRITGDFEYLNTFELNK